MLRQFFSLTLISLLSGVDTKSEMEPRVVSGQRDSIRNFPHSVFLVINTKSGSIVCGSSIVNQQILLTAAHCVDMCINMCLDSFALAGSTNKRDGERIYIRGTLIHEQFSRKLIQNDIGLILLQKPLNLGKLIKRIALMRNPPLKKYMSATIAGWGLIDELQSVHTDYLYSVEQKVWTFAKCQQMIPNIPSGTICAGDVERQRYASEGDSGSALIINKYIQIGIVSYKRPDISRAIVVYTDVAYFYDWIKNNSRKLYCDYV